MAVINQQSGTRIDEISDRERACITERLIAEKGFTAVAVEADWPDASASCENAVVSQLQGPQAHAADYLRHDGVETADAFFHARQNARLVRKAENYYRTMFRGRISAWNIRDRHMMEMLDALAQHLSQTSGEPAKLSCGRTFPILATRAPPTLARKANGRSASWRANMTGARRC